MNRIKFIMDALDITKIQAMITNEMIKDIPNDNLLAFMVFRTKHIQPKMSRDLITKTAIYEYKKNQIINKIKNGFSFSTIEKMKNFIHNFFIGKDICNAPADFIKQVVIALNQDLELINKYAINDFGNYKKLNSEDEETVYNWLFRHQNHIGYTNYDKPPLEQINTQCMQSIPQTQND